MDVTEKYMLYVLYFLLTAGVVENICGNKKDGGVVRGMFMLDVVC